MGTWLNGGGGRDLVKGGWIKGHESEQTQNFKALGILGLHFGPCLMKLRSSTRREAPSS